MIAPPRTLLAFDYGKRRIGVAVGQTLTATATPLAIVPCRRRGPDWREIARLIARWQPAALIVGIPLNMDGTEQPMTRAARHFARQLEQRYGLPVHGVDERLSSVEARARRQSPGDLDAIAAQVILETWLAEQPSAVQAGCANRFAR